MHVCVSVSRTVCLSVNYNAALSPYLSIITGGNPTECPFVHFLLQPGLCDVVIDVEFGIVFMSSGRALVRFWTQTTLRS